MYINNYLLVLPWKEVTLSYHDNYIFSQNFHFIRSSKDGFTVAKIVQYTRDSKDWHWSVYIPRSGRYIEDKTFSLKMAQRKCDVLLKELGYKIISEKSLILE